MNGPPADPGLTPQTNRPIRDKPVSSQSEVDGMDVIERMAHAMWMQNGVKLREHYPWDSDHPYARELREAAMGQARIALANCNCGGGVDLLADRK